MMQRAELEAGAERFNRKIAARNQREYVAGALVGAIFTVFAVVRPEPLVQLGSLLVVAAAIFVCWHLARSTSANTDGDATRDIVSNYRARLIRERALLASVPLWYLAPFLPGFVLITLGKLDAGSELTGIWLAVNIAVPIVIFGGIWWLNSRAAAELQRRIEALDSGVHV